MRPGEFRRQLKADKLAADDCFRIHDSTLTQKCPAWQASEIFLVRLSLSAMRRGAAVPAAGFGGLSPPGRPRHIICPTVIIAPGFVGGQSGRSEALSRHGAKINC
jgi:hypothetical protein